MSLGIDEIYHIIHLSDTLPPLDAWYDEVFSPRRGMMDNHYSPNEQRYASLLTIGDCVIEALAPARDVDGWDAMPIGRYYEKFGPHWHSLAWYVDDVGVLWDHLRSLGIRVIRGGGPGAADERPKDFVPIFTHPKDTIAQLQFMQRRTLRKPDDYHRPGDADPRFLPGWSPTWWATNHGLTLERLAYVTIVTSDLERAKKIYVDALQGVVVGEGESKLTATRDLYVSIGKQVVVQLAQPLSTDALAGADQARNGDTIHAVCFQVNDLAAAERYLAGRGIGILDRDDSTLVADPATTFHAPYRFTTALPGAPS
jgi:catechol 2,3-dioxygenase-like lactoylglutathione lyase family enzyme